MFFYFRDLLNNIKRKWSQTGFFKKNREISKSVNEAREESYKTRKFNENSNFDNKVIFNFLIVFLIWWFDVYAKLKKMDAKQKNFENIALTIIEQNSKLLEQNNMLLQEMKANSLRFFLFLFQNT